MIKEEDEEEEEKVAGGHPSQMHDIHDSVSLVDDGNPAELIELGEMGLSNEAGRNPVKAFQTKNDSVGDYDLDVDENGRRLESVEDATPERY